jgi:hypothetical protein
VLSGRLPEMALPFTPQRFASARPASVAAVQLPRCSDAT